MRHLRRIRIAYVLAAVGALLIAGALIAALGNGPKSNGGSVPPQHVDIGGKGPNVTNSNTRLEVTA